MLHKEAMGAKQRRRFEVNNIAVAATGKKERKHKGWVGRRAGVPPEKGDRRL